MSVPAQDPTIVIVANGSTTAFTCPFYADADADVVVLVNGVKTTSGFTVSNSGLYALCVVTFASPPASGTVLTISRVVALQRITDYVRNGDLLAGTLNRDFDRLWMALQGQDQNVGLSIHVPYETSQASTLLPSAADRANKVIAFGPAGEPTVMVPVSGSASDVMIQLAQNTGLSNLGFIQSAAGAKARTALIKNRDTLDIFDFITYGDGRDETDALLKAFAAALGDGKILRGRPGYTVGFSTTIPIGVTMRYEGGGMILKPLGMTTGYAAQVKGHADAGALDGYLHGFRLNTTPNEASALDGLSLGDAAGVVAGFSVMESEITGFRDNLAFIEANVYLNSFVKVSIAKAWRRGIAMYATSNSGESNTFTNCRIVSCANSTDNARGFYTDPNAADSDTKFFGGSMSYNDFNGEINQGAVDVIGVHQENSNATPMWLLNNISGKEKSVLNIQGGRMISGPNGKQTEPTQGRPWMIYASTGTYVTVDGTKYGGYFVAGRAADYVTRLVKRFGATDGYLRTIRLNPIIDADPTTSLPPDICDDTNMVTHTSTAPWAGFRQINGSGVTFESSTTDGYGGDVTARTIVGSTVGTGSTGGYEVPPIAVRPGQNVVGKVALKLVGVTQLTTVAAIFVYMRSDGTYFKDPSTGTDANAQGGTGAGQQPLRGAPSGTGDTAYMVSTGQHTVPVGAAYVRFQILARGLIGRVTGSEEKLWVLG